MSSQSKFRRLLPPMETVMALLLLFFVYQLSQYAAMLMDLKRPVTDFPAGAAAVGESPSSDAAANSSQGPVVVLDSGHGGNDPGKIGVDGSLEKDINLQIAQKLKAYLEASDVTVIMTREQDVGLYSENDSHKKMADMKNRCALINHASPDLVVSIHQNSYHQEPINGGQVFYYKSSEKGKQLAEILQKRFDYVLGSRNTRKAKANDNYYLLLHVKSPIVIVECGFLSNWQESALLNSKDYQDRLAWTIHMGIMEYLNTRR